MRQLVTRDLLALLVSTAFFEVTGNIVYVMLMERAFDLGGGATSVGIFLVIQAGAQLALGSVVGSFADNLGARRAGIFGLVAQASLALGLALTSSIEMLYLIALHLTVARLFVITSRLPLLTRLNRRTSYLRANAAVFVLAGFGLFLGPAIGAALILLWRDPTLPFLFASGTFLLAAIPLLFMRSSLWPSSVRPLSILTEIREGWTHIVRHRHIWEVLICLLISSTTFGAIMPLLTSLAKSIGLGMEGSGVLVAALGLGWMLGPLSAGFLVRKLRYTSALLLTGLVTPLAAVAIAFMRTVSGIQAALVLSAFAGASLNVIVISIIQRLTPSAIQGSVIGAQQALSGLIWIVSAASITGILSLLPSSSDPRVLFSPIGGLGAVMVLACWIIGRRTLRPLLSGGEHRQL